MIDDIFAMLFARRVTQNPKRCAMNEVKLDEAFHKTFEMEKRFNKTLKSEF